MDDRESQFNCPSCGDRDLKVTGISHGTAAVRCVACGLVGPIADFFRPRDDTPAGVPVLSGTGAGNTST